MEVFNFSMMHSFKESRRRSSSIRTILQKIIGLQNLLEGVTNPITKLELREKIMKEKIKLDEIKQNGSTYIWERNYKSRIK